MTVRANNMSALLFTNSNDDRMADLTKIRSMASLPFGGRYRIIDFHLSNLVNAGVFDVAIIPRANYRSLMDHIGSGKPWDLDRKKGGLTYLPPFIIGNDGTYHGHIDAINKIASYISYRPEEYIALCDCDTVLNFDIGDMLEKHIERGADISFAYKNGVLPETTRGRLVGEFSESGELTDMIIAKNGEKVCNYGIGITILRRDALLSLAASAEEHGYRTINEGLFRANFGKLKIFGYEIKNHVAVIDSMESYIKANMSVLEKSVRQDLFSPDRPVYTKTRDDMPTKYGLESDVKNSLLGEGCVIDGKVENSVLFRGVKVEKGAEVTNCILMQETVVGENSVISYVTSDKDAVISADSLLRGAENNHYIINKGQSV